MTAAALVKSADLKRMADIALSKGVRVEIEVDGRIIRVAPDIPVIHSPGPVDNSPQDFASVAEWQTWRDQERAREVQRRS